MKKRPLPFQFDRRRITGRLTSRYFWIMIGLLVLMSVAWTFALHQWVGDIIPHFLTALLLFLLFLPMLPLRLSTALQLAQKRGWDYQAEQHYASGEVVSLFPSTQIKLFSVSGNKILVGIVSGTIKAFRFWLFRYNVKSNQLTTGLQQFTTLVIELPQALPRFVIDDHSVFGFGKFVDLTHTETISLEGEFGKKFSVYVPKTQSNEARLIALSFLAPDVMNIYLQYFGACCMISEGDKMAILSSQDLYSSEKLDTLVEGLTTLLPKLERQLHLRDTVKGQVPD